MSSNQKPMFPAGRIILIIGASVLLSLILIPRIISSMKSESYEDFVIMDIDFCDVPDGIYDGQFESSGIMADVSVTFISGQFVYAELYAQKGLSAECFSAVCEAVYNKQTLMIEDGELGTRIEDRVLLKAIEIAVLSGDGGMTA